MRHAAQQSPKTDTSALWDAAVFSKILPRLRGAESAELLDALSKLESLFERSTMPRCQAKAKQMRARLQDTGVTGFWS